MPTSARKSFTAVLEPLEWELGWIIAPIPFEIAKTWPVMCRLRVRGEIFEVNQKSGRLNRDGEGFAFRTSLFPDSRGDGHFLLVNKKMQAAAKATLGSKVRIQLEPDFEERVAEMPPELASALKGDRRLRPWFDRLGPSRRKDIGGWVNQARSKESRKKRAIQMAEWLLLTIEGETDPPPILKATFQRQPRARAGWEAMTPTQRRNHLLGIFHYQSTESREKRAAKAIEDALRVVRKSGSKAGEQ
jgi:uncharacterized protein YdeI (YjbR/CyaY-like superfamily)